MPIRNLFSFFSSSKRKSERELLSNDIEHLKVTLSDERSSWEQERAQFEQRIQDQEKLLVKYLAVIDEQQDDKVTLRKRLDNGQAKIFWLVKTVGSFKKDGTWSIPICHNCSIQYEGRCDPKVLGCGHIICVDCARRIRESFYFREDFIKCPFCQKRTDLTEAGCTGLPTPTEPAKSNKSEEEKLIDIN